MIKRIIYLFLYMLLTCHLTSAQQASSLQDYLLNGLYNINPAASGIEGKFISQLSYTKRWVGMPDSPESQVFSNSIRLGEEEFYDPKKFLNKPFININNHVGIGLTVSNQTEGPLHHTGAMLAYAYHISIHESRLSFGLSAMITQIHLSTIDFKPVDDNDPELYVNTSAFVPDFNFGVMLYNHKSFLGISANGLVNINKTMDHKQTVPDIVACGGYKFVMNTSFSFEPSLFIQKIGQGSITLDLNGKLYFREKNWVLFSYQGSGDVLTGIGLNIKENMQLCYIYAMSTNGIAPYTSGSQRISLRVDIAELFRKHEYR